MPRNKKRLEEKIKKAKSRKEKAIAYYNLGLFHDNNGREIKAVPNYKLALKFGLEKRLKSQALAWLASSLYKTSKPKDALKKVRESEIIADGRLQNFLTGLENRIKKSMRL